MLLTQNSESSTSIGVETTDSTSRYTQDIDLYCGPGSTSGSGQGALVQADATAIGTDTFASLEASVVVAEGSGVDSTSISVDALAAAQSPNESLALTTAVAETFGEADILFSLSQSSTQTVTDENGSTSISQSSIDIYALNFSLDPLSEDDAVSAPAGAPIPSADTELAIFEPDDCGCEPVDFVIDGNVAYFEVDAAALAEDSYVDVAVDALAVEDQFSSVTAVVVVLVD